MLMISERANAVIFMIIDFFMTVLVV